MSQPNPATCLCSSTQSFHWLLEWNSQPLAVHLLCISCHFVIGHMQCNHAENSLKPLWLYRANSGPSHGPWTAQGNVYKVGDWMGLDCLYGSLWHLWHFMTFYGLLWPFMAPKGSQLPWMWMVMADIRGRELSIYLLHLPRITRITRICLWLNQRYCRCSVFQELHQIDSTGMPGSAPAKPSGPHIRHENDQQKTWKKHHPGDSKGMCIWHHMTYVCRHCEYCIYCMYV